MWRAAIQSLHDFLLKVVMFQYRERSVEGCNFTGLQPFLYLIISFNTENGMWRAAIRQSWKMLSSILLVSIPRTVCGGLQFHHPRIRTGRRRVSIPRTVCGGLQFLISEIASTRLVMFQYRERYVEGCNTQPSP